MVVLERMRWLGWILIAACDPKVPISIGPEESVGEVPDGSGGDGGDGDGSGDTADTADPSDTDETDCTDPRIWYQDEDGDGYGDADEALALCEGKAGYTLVAGDCDDADAGAHPGATEVCDDLERDDDCDGLYDDQDPDTEAQRRSWYPDYDGDGYGGDYTAYVIQSCDAVTGYSLNDADCDDTRHVLHPGAIDACNGYDDDCDGTVDDACVDRCPVHADPSAPLGGDGTEAWPYPSIADAMTYGGAWCDDILLGPGTYAETVDYGGRDYVIASTAGAETTVIEAPSGGSVITFDHGETRAAVLQGVTVTGGTGTYRDWTGYYGGGIFADGASPTILDCVIEGNAAAGGGGAQLLDFEGWIEGTTFSNNSATYWGGGVTISSSGLAVLRRNTFTGNVADYRGSSLLASGSMSIDGNHFDANGAATTDADIWLSSTSLSFTNNLVTGSSGTALYLEYDGSDLTNNTIDGAGTYGLQFAAWSTSTVRNNLITGSGDYDVTSYDADDVTWESNDVWGGALGTYAWSSTATGLDGNLSVNPKYAAAGDHSLQSTSPCVDAGQDLATITEDIDGTARPLGAATDIGAKESW